MNKRLLKFVKLAKDILKGKRIGDEGSSITALTYASLLNDIYKAISIIFLILGTGLLVSAVKNLSLSFSSLIAFFISLMLTVTCLVFFFAFWAMSNEIRDEIDKNKVLSELTTVATLIALVIAALSLKQSF